jgi:lipid-A-disaccharide synthase
VNRLAAILPFEESYFRSRGVETDFVGHPLIEQLEAVRPDPSRVAEFKQFGSPIIACLAGSRRHVIEEVLPGQIEVASAIARAYPKAGFLFAAADETAAAAIRDALGVDPETRVGPDSNRSAFGVSGCTPGGRNLRHRVEVGSNAEILAAADLALVASGTATLEVAWHRLPMVVMYNGSKWGYRLVGRFLITTPHLCLVNILAGKRAVPEFMPYYTSTAPIAAEALDLLANASRRETVKRDLDAIVKSLGTRAAAPRVAALALNMARNPVSSL